MEQPSPHAVIVAVHLAEAQSECSRPDTKTTKCYQVGLKERRSRKLHRDSSAGPAAPKLDFLHTELRPQLSLSCVSMQDAWMEQEGYCILHPPFAYSFWIYMQARGRGLHHAKC